MKKTPFILLLLLLFFVCKSIIGQSLEAIEQKYESFEYNTVIKLVNNKLLSDTTLSISQKIRLNKLKAISFYSLSETDSTRATFIKLLYLDEEVSFDPVQTSPKIIEYFNSVRAVFQNIKDTQEADSEEVNNDSPSENELITFDGDLFASAMYQSILLPGLGHLSAGSNTKGWFLTSVGAANLAAMVYYIFDANSKEKKYLNETDLGKINSKYNLYNSAYQTRNILIGTFTAIWLYSQIDLIFNKDDFFIKILKPSFSISSNNYHSTYYLKLSLTF